jgi:hypothetical protein
MIPEVSLLGSWQPATSEERLDRLESLAAIHQLAVRYALAVDSRDLETLVSLFAADVTVGKDRKGREALKVWFARILKGMRVSVHFVGNHVIDFDDPDHARGIVYCQDELERPATGQWQQGKIQYWDDYCRVEDRWYFTRPTASRPGTHSGLSPDFRADRTACTLREFLPQARLADHPRWRNAPSCDK